MNGLVKGTVLFTCAAVLMFAVYVMVETRNLEVRYVSVGGSINAEQRHEVYGKLAELEPVDLTISRLKTELEAISWIFGVTVKRDWPDGVVITVTPQRAIALWNDDAFINEEGEVFFASFEFIFDQQGSHLAQLYGPQGSERKVMQQYQRLSKAVLKTGRSLQTLTLDHRGAWTFTNDLGIEVMLGKEQLMERIRTLLLVSEHVAFTQRLHEIEKIDTRYSNGIAVSWKQDMDTPTQEYQDLASSYKSQRVQKL